MSKSLKLDNDNNLVIDDQGVSLIEGDEALAQDVRNRLLLYKGECFYNPELGLCFHEDLHSLNKNGIIQSIKNKLDEDPRIKNYDIQIVSEESGKLDVEIKLITKEGNTVYV